MFQSARPFVLFARAVRRASLLVLLAALVGMAAACGDSPTEPGTPPPGQITTEDLVVGTGALAQSGTILTVDYTGWLYDGTKDDKKGSVFDSSIGRQPLQFVLGTGSVITGWDVGLPGMRVGGVRRLTIPPQFAYGSRAQAGIPANSTLIFEVTLLSVD